MLSLKTDVNVTAVGNKQENVEKRNLFFVGILKATDEKTGILIRILNLVVRIRGSGSFLKRH
jgi:hypothetical protein